MSKQFFGDVLNSEKTVPVYEKNWKFVVDMELVRAEFTKDAHEETMNREERPHLIVTLA